MLLFDFFPAQSVGISVYKQAPIKDDSIRRHKENISMHLGPVSSDTQSHEVILSTIFEIVYL